jgi:hypothetical protein
VPDHEDSVAGIAHGSLEPLLARMHALLADDCADGLSRDLFRLAADIYAIGHRDGVRHAVAEIAPAAERRGLRLWLGEEHAEAQEERGQAVPRWRGAP